MPKLISFCTFDHSHNRPAQSSVLAEVYVRTFNLKKPHEWNSTAEFRGINHVTGPESARELYYERTTSPSSVVTLNNHQNNVPADI